MRPKMHTSTDKFVSQYSFIHSALLHPPILHPSSSFVSPSSLSFSRIYRFLNNPESLFGSLGLYAVALILGSWTGLFVALSLSMFPSLFCRHLSFPQQSRVCDWLSGFVWRCSHSRVMDCVFRCWCRTSGFNCFRLSG